MVKASDLIVVGGIAAIAYLGYKALSGIGGFFKGIGGLLPSLPGLPNIAITEGTITLPSFGGTTVTTPPLAHLWEMGTMQRGYMYQPETGDIIGIDPHERAPTKREYFSREPGTYGFFAQKDPVLSAVERQKTRAHIEKMRRELSKQVLPPTKQYIPRPKIREYPTPTMDRVTRRDIWR